MKPNCECGVKYDYHSTWEKDDLVYSFYECPICKAPSHEVSYKYSPRDGRHKCQWEHLGVKFVDGPKRHSISQIDRCTRCGDIRETSQDTYGAGISGRVEIEDPRVSNRLLLNKSSWERLIPKELQELRTTPLPQEVVLPSEG